MEEVIGSNTNIPVEVDVADEVRVMMEKVPSWAQRNFLKHELHLLDRWQDEGNVDPRVQQLIPALGIMEEVGELFSAYGFAKSYPFVVFGKIAHHTLKWIQGIKGSSEYHIKQLYVQFDLLDAWRTKFAPCDTAPVFAVHKTHEDSSQKYRYYDRKEVEDAVIDIGVFLKDLAGRTEVDQYGERAKEIVGEVLQRDFATKRRMVKFTTGKELRFSGQIGVASLIHVYGSSVPGFDVVYLNPCYYIVDQYETEKFVHIEVAMYAD